MATKTRPQGIIADFRSEDGIFDFHLDVKEYFETQASDDTLLEMAATEWNSETTKEIADFYSDDVKAIAALLDYCLNTDQDYEVEVDAGDAMAWVERNKPKLIAKMA